MRMKDLVETKEGLEICDVSNLWCYLIFFLHSPAFWHRLRTGGPVTCCMLFYYITHFSHHLWLFSGMCLELCIKDLMAKTRLQGEECSDGLAMPSEVLDYEVEAWGPCLCWLGSKWPHSSPSWDTRGHVLGPLRTLVPSFWGYFWGYCYHVGWTVFWDINPWVCFEILIHGFTLLSSFFVSPYSST